MNTNTLATPQHTSALRGYVCPLEAAGNDESCGGKASVTVHVLSEVVIFPTWWKVLHEINLLKELNLEQDTLVVHL